MKPSESDRKGMTHKQAVRRVRNWMTNSKQFGVVLAELATRNRETPDVIGWKQSHSTLVEVKVSRSDFLGDKKKCFRRHEESGMGDHRYFAAPKGLLKPEEMPDGWGLLEIGEHQIREIAEAQPKNADKRCECNMLLSVLRRLEISTAVFVRQEPHETE